MEGHSRKGWEEPSIAVPGIAVNAIRNDGREASRIFIGARIKMSRLGKARNPYFTQKVGMVVGSGQLNSSFRVLFDGRKTPITLHEDYIEPSASE
jgi:hypothetical protein